ncbi:MAG: hypothetical protein PHO02_07065 [Candidatus Nanoarchaeia archaeon]|nr:hypothetical protein [Candidatus Nanoarchaeia archaeon]
MALETILKAYLVTFWQEEGRTAVNYSKIDAEFDAEKVTVKLAEIKWTLDDIATVYITKPADTIKGHAIEFHGLISPKLKEAGLLAPEEGRKKVYFVQVTGIPEREDAAKHIARKLASEYFDNLKSLN